MEEIQIYNLASQNYIANGLFQIVVIIGVFIAFRTARFASQNSIFAKVMASLFAVMIGFFNLTVRSLRFQIDQQTAIMLADAKAAGATLTAQASAFVERAGASAGDVLPAQQNLFADPGTDVFTLIFLIIALGACWIPNTNFSEK